MQIGPCDTVLSYFDIETADLSFLEVNEPLGIRKRPLGIRASYFGVLFFSLQEWSWLFTVIWERLCCNGSRGVGSNRCCSSTIRSAWKKKRKKKLMLDKFKFYLQKTLAEFNKEVFEYIQRSYLLSKNSSIASETLSVLRGWAVRTSRP